MIQYSDLRIEVDKFNFFEHSIWLLAILTELKVTESLIILERLDFFEQL
jgi:hypothetical protein